MERAVNAYDQASCGVSSGRIFLRSLYSPENVARCRSIPGGKWERRWGAWVYPATPAVARAVLSAFPHVEGDAEFDRLAGADGGAAVPPLSAPRRVRGEVYRPLPAPAPAPAPVAPRYCGQCGRALPSGAVFCPGCNLAVDTHGEQRSGLMGNCPNGHGVDLADSFCETCGTKIPTADDLRRELALRVERQFKERLATVGAIGVPAALAVAVFPSLLGLAQSGAGVWVLFLLLAAMGYGGWLLLSLVGWAVWPVVARWLRARAG